MPRGDRWLQEPPGAADRASVEATKPTQPPELEGWAGHARLVLWLYRDVFREVGQERLQQRRLPGSDLTRDYDESVGEPDRGFHVRLGASVLLAPVDEFRVRRQSERLLGQSEMFEIRHVSRVYLLFLVPGYAAFSVTIVD